jgi:hypothetical protein
MTRRIPGLVLAALTLCASALVVGGDALAAPGGDAAPSAQLAPILQQHSFGTISSGTTACNGPLSPSNDQGVQIFGFTNAAASLTWQVFSVSSQSAPTLVFRTTATFVDQTIPPSGNLLYHACVRKAAGAAQDYDLTLNSQPLE